MFPLYGGFTAFLLIFCIQKKQAYDFTSILGNSSNELAAKDGHSCVLTDFHYSNFLLMWKERSIQIILKSCWIYIIQNMLDKHF